MLLKLHKLSRISIKWFEKNKSLEIEFKGGQRCKMALNGGKGICHTECRLRRIR